MQFVKAKNRKTDTLEILYSKACFAIVEFIKNFFQKHFFTPMTLFSPLFIKRYSETDGDMLGKEGLKNFAFR